jgi:hypothetical protein
VRVACFCGTVFEADPPAAMCPNCDAPPAICASSEEQFTDLMTAYSEAREAIHNLPEAA